MQIIQLGFAGVVPCDYTGIVEWNDGDIHYYKEGKLHRENGPAIQSENGSEFWYKEGKLHRLDGIAYKRLVGLSFKFGWFIEGKNYSEEDFNKEIVKRNN